MKNSILFLSSLIFLFFLDGCQKKEQNMKKILHLNFESEPLSLDPRVGTNVISQSATRALFEGLMKIGEDGKVCLGLAKSYHISEDQKTYTFILKPTMWSDGSKVTAYDFEYGWKAAADPNFPCRLIHLFYHIKNAKEIQEKKLSVEELKVKAVDDITLVVELENPTPYFLSMLANPLFSPIKRSKENFQNRDFVCNGPFRLAKYEANKGMQLVRNPHYHLIEQISLEAIQISFVKDPQTAMYLFEQGKIDFLGNPISKIPFDEEVKLLEKKKLQVKSIAGIYWLGFNTHVFPYQNENFRKALAMSLQRKSFSEALNGRVEAKTFVPLNLSEAPSGLLADFNLDQAKRYLEKGVQELQCDLKDFPCLKLTYCDQISGGKKIALLIKQQWETHLGIQVKLEELEWNSYLEAFFQCKLEIAGIPWYSYLDDAIYHLETFKNSAHPTNWTLWENAEYQSYLDSSKKIANVKRRKEFLQKAEEKLAEQMPVIPLFYEDYRYIQKPYVANIVITDLGEIDFRYCRIEK